MSLLNFNLAEISAEEERSVIPVGTYGAVIESAEMRETRTGTGQFLALGFSLQGNAQYDNARVWTNLNLFNQNPKAQDIGRKELRRLADALGMSNIVDTDEVIGKRLNIKVGIEKSEGYDDRNTVKAFLPLQDAAIPSFAQPAPQPTQPAPAAPGVSFNGLNAQQPNPFA